MAETSAVDYSLANPDTLTKYKTAAQISHKVLEAVTALCVDGATIVSICEQGDKLIEEEVSKVYKGKKILKGPASPVTISPAAYVTPYTPLLSDANEAATQLKKNEVVKIQLGTQIDGFAAIVCDTIVVGASPNSQSVVTGREADLLLATHYANELLLRLMVPKGLLAASDDEKAKAATEKTVTQARMTQLIEKVAKAYDCTIVESTTSWLFERNEIEGKKKIVLAPGEIAAKGEGLPEVGEVWGVEVGLSLGTGKVKTIENRATLHRRTATTYALKRPSSRQILSEIVKKFGTFPFSLRQLEDERAGKVGIVECVRSGVVRQYEVIADKDASPVSRLFTTLALTKNGVQKIAAPPVLDLEKVKSEKSITDEEILKILAVPIAKPTSSKSKNKKKKKKAAKKTGTSTTADAHEEEADDDDEEEEDD